jgi:RNA polymerase sigma-70 factor (ECF subfamily)
MNRPVHSITSEALDSSAESQLSFAAFVEAEHDRLFRALYLVAGNRGESEEVMQDAFLKVWERWDRVREMEDPTGYLFRTALNLYRKSLRRASLALRRVVTLSPRPDAFASIEDREVVFAALKLLGPKDRAAIVATALLDLSSEEAGRALGMSASTIRMRASRARTQLRRTLEEQ